MENKNNERHPIDRANIFSKLFFLYNVETFKKGIKKSWTTNNLYLPRSSDVSIFLGEWIQREWDQHVKNRHGTNKKPNIFLVLWLMFRPNILFDAFILLMSQIVLRVFEPTLLGFFLEFFKHDSNSSKNEMIQCGIILISMIGLRTVAHVHYKLCAQLTGLKIKTACSYLILSKILKLNKATLRQISNGNILNLISNDLNRLDFSTNYLHYLWASPLFVLCISYLLYDKIGVPGLIGMSWLGFVVCIQSYSSKLTGKYRLKVAQKTDIRIRILDEIIGGIQVIKMYAWEKPFGKLIFHARKLEMKELRKTTFLRACLQSVTVFVNSSAICVAMLTMVYLEHKITAAKIFSLVIYLGALNFTVSLMFTLALQKSVELYESFKRINRFLNMEEKVPIKCSKSLDDTRLILKNVCVQSTSQITGNNDLLNKESKEIPLITVTEALDILCDINVQVKNGKLICVIGSIGSGKSCLLQAILGEATLSSGTIEIFGEISYSPQEPWILATSIKENIIFGENFDEYRYQEVLEVCQLIDDLNQFPLGDKTVVGERGTLLSGGQKARISLARAIYKDVDIYLLDDPFSAVDVSVAKKIYENCITNFLKNKTRILITHHVQYLDKEEKVILINSGRVEAIETFDVLLNSKNEFLEHIFKKDKSLDATKLVEQEVTNQKILTLATTKSLNHETNSKNFLQKRLKNLPLFVYLLSGSSLTFMLLVLLSFVFVQISVTSVDLYMGYWTYVEEFGNVTRKPSAVLWVPLKTLPIFSRSMYSYFYIILLVFFAIAATFKVFFFVNMAMRSSRVLHDKMFASVLRSSMRFFDTNTSGQILNRFSTDLMGIDEIMPRNIMESVNIILTLFTRLLIVSILKPFLVFVIFILYGILSVGIKYFTATSKNLKRVKSELMAPILTHINVSLQGLISIRAFKAEKKIKTEFTKHLDRYTSSWFMFGVITATFSLFVEMICFIFISIVTFSFIVAGNEFGLNPSEIGIAITQSLMLTTAVQYGVIQLVETSYQLVSVERIQEYIDLPEETKSKLSKNPPDEWPNKGKIIFKDVSVKYETDGSAIIKNMNFTVDSKEKIGIVGRTGAGKSSMIAAICRLVIVEGLIEIDGINTNNVELDMLRSKISVIPQNPILFTGTLRFNLDPFGEQSDMELYKVLKKVEISELLNRALILDENICDGGYFYSVGQKQLICLARAILRKSKIILLDEATASVDPRTDAIIQKVIRQHFIESTVLTVAHRLNTVLDSDKIAVVESGRIIEFDKPEALLENPTSRLSEMVAQNTLNS